MPKDKGSISERALYDDSMRGSGGTANRSRSSTSQRPQAVSPGRAANDQFRDDHEAQLERIIEGRGGIFPEPLASGYDGARGVPGDHVTSAVHRPNVSDHRTKNAPSGVSTIAPMPFRNLRSEKP